MTDKMSMDQMIENSLRDEVVAMNNPECKDCNECCSMGTLLTDEEYEHLKRFLKKDKYGKFLYQQGLVTIHKYLKQGTVYWMCPFSHGKRCRIYSKRPQMCRQFHCDESEKSREFRDSMYPTGSHIIAELFQKEGFNMKYLKR